MVNDLKVRNGFVKLPHNFFYITRELSVAVKFFLAYLLSKDNFFGDNGEFYLTDEEIQDDLKVGRSSLNRWRKRLKMTPFVDYVSGKYKSSATTYNVKGIKTILSNEENKGRISKRDIKYAKMNHKAYQNEPDRVSNWHNNKEVNKEVKEEVKKELSEGSASACFESQPSPSLNQTQNHENRLVSENQEKIRALFKNKGSEAVLGILCGQGLTHSEAYNIILELRLEESSV